MAHIGKRYDGAEAARANEGLMLDVEARDRQRIAALQSGDAEAFWSLVQEKRDDLNWCGSAPFYTYLRAVPQARGELLDYDHWQIDPESVVSYGAMRFSHNGKPPSIMAP
jgi:predicted class III extradiol MEMO1 family dioxygenase